MLVFAALISRDRLRRRLHDATRSGSSAPTWWRFAYVAAIGLGAFFFVMVQYLTGSAWSVTVRRIMENIMITLPVGAILFIPIAFGLKDIYPWTDPRYGRGRARCCKAKSGYLTRELLPASHLRLISCCGRSGFSRSTIRSTKQDTERSVQQMYIALALERAGLVPGGGGRNAGSL